MRSAHKIRHRQAFTLIEMLVVIFIITIVTSISVPRYYDYAMRARFQETVQKVVTVFAEARNKAVHSGTECVVRYDSQAGTFIVQSEVDQPGTDLPVVMQESAEAAPTIAAEPMQLGENVTVGDFQVESAHAQGQPMNGARPMEIHFHEDGRADAAFITLVSGEGARVTIEIAPLTGRAAVREDMQ